MNYVYKQTEPGLWTVGHYEDDTWLPESDHGSKDEAADRVHWLNGGEKADDRSERNLDQWIDELGQEYGFGYLMRLASELWKVNLRIAGQSTGGAFEVGPAAALTVECGCGSPSDCEWCCGTGWLTGKVKEVKDKENWFVLEYEGRSDLVTTLTGMFFYPKQIRNLRQSGLLSLDEMIDALKKRNDWKDTQQKIAELLNSGAVKGSSLRSHSGDLLPCPFCGSKAEKLTGWINPEEARCSNQFCDAHGSSWSLEHWNTRRSETIEEEVERRR